MNQPAPSAQIAIPPGLQARTCRCGAFVVDVPMLKGGRDYRRVVEIEYLGSTSGMVHQCPKRGAE